MALPPQHPVTLSAADRRVYQGVGWFSSRSWPEEDLAIIYCGQSGDTHLLDTTSLELLQLIQQSPRSSAELEQALQDVAEPSAPGQVAAFVEAALLQLQSIGVVSPLSR